MRDSELCGCSATLPFKFDLNQLFKIIIISGEVGYRKSLDKGISLRYTFDIRRC